MITNICKRGITNKIISADYASHEFINQLSFYLNLADNIRGKIDKFNYYMMIYNQFTTILVDIYQSKYIPKSIYKRFKQVLKHLILILMDCEINKFLGKNS